MVESPPTGASGSMLTRRQRIPRGIEEVFAFFADPANLEAITPPWLHFRVLGASTDEVEEGTLIDYRLRLHGVPIRWRSRIRAWNPPFGFIDEQVRGPYRSWVHHHDFEPDGDGVWVGDRVEYRVPGGALVDRLFVRRDLRRIFDFRTDELARLLK